MQLTLFIKDLVIAGKHGVHQHERETPQRFKVTVELGITGSQAVISDNLADTLDWSHLKAAIISIVEDNSYNLMERLAMEIAAKMLEDRRVVKAVVIIDKMDAFESGIPGVRLKIEQRTTPT